MSASVPPILQRFRARELQKLVKAGGYLQKPSQSRPPYLFMKDTDITNLRMHAPLRNPFLPRQVPPKPAVSSTPGFEGDGQMKEKQKQKQKQRKTWMGAQYSLRRQADLIKAARASGTLHLLPPGPKFSVEELEVAKEEYRERAAKARATSTRIEEVIRVRSRDSKERLGERIPVATAGTGAGARVKAKAKEVEKGSLWRRRSQKTLVRRRGKAALGYPGVVFRWTGKVPAKRVALTFYAGRRRMFKGHKWERNLENRKAEIAVRMRDMGGRIARFKNVYKRRRAQPLKPAPSRKKESLPF